MRPAPRPLEGEGASSAIRADHAVARILAVTDDEDALYARVLAAIGEALHWQVAALWQMSPDADGLRCVEAWCSPGFDGGGFVELTRQTRLQQGEGLPGRVWQAGEPAWIADAPRAENFPRARGAAAAGLRSAVCFPVRTPRGVLGAIELFTTAACAPDEGLLATMASLGSQIGQFVERRRAQREVEESGERKQAILDAALDSIVTIDHRGRVLEFNAAAERAFGYSAGDAVGREMAELIVPPSLRERHRAGLARYLETGTARLLGRRIEILGMRADGSEFPVELTITRINLPGPPRFTGYLRDITGRKRAEADLRASRARIVDAADAARRRLERDLHDGAQQQLVNVGLTLQLALSTFDKNPEAAERLVAAAVEDLRLATGELRELARGIHPAVLSDGGLGPALDTLAARSQVAVRVLEAPAGRLPARVEATAYFLVSEALTNVARHAHATSAEVVTRREDGRLLVEVRDDGDGGARLDGGSGLMGLADRVAALDGQLEVVSPAGEGTVIRAWMPCE